MKLNLLAVCIVFMFLVAPAFAIFDTGMSETFNQRLDGWRTSGDVSWASEGYAKLGNRSTNKDSQIWCQFVAPTSGSYNLNFDYKFSGIDTSQNADDTMLVGIGTSKAALYDSFGATSSSGLNGGQWQTVNSKPVQLEAGKKYWIGFELNESKLGGIKLVTKLDIDNVSLTKIRAIPAPAAIFLASVGVALVGWLRSKKAL
jgi:hypothetical protein